MIKLIVAGATGHYGQKVLELAAARPEFEIVGRVSSKDPLDTHIVPGAVVVDFSSPDASIHHARLCAQHGMKAVIATTGLSVTQESFIQDAGRSTAIVYSPNTSLGVNVVLKLLEQTARSCPDYAVALTDVHHARKKDAPSGTARRMVQAMPNVNVAVDSIREGDVIGTHIITFTGPYETITITHEARDRTLFADGALTAAVWVAQQKPGLYDMWNVLGLK